MRNAQRRLAGGMVGIALGAPLAGLIALVASPVAVADDDPVSFDVTAGYHVPPFTVVDVGDVYDSTANANVGTFTERDAIFGTPTATHAVPVIDHLQETYNAYTNGSPTDDIIRIDEHALEHDSSSGGTALLSNTLTDTINATSGHLQSTQDVIDLFGQTFTLFDFHL